LTPGSSGSTGEKQLEKQLDIILKKECLTDVCQTKQLENNNEKQLENNNEKQLESLNKELSLNEEFNKKIIQKIQSLILYETQTATLYFRVRPIIKMYYDYLSREEKKIVKDSLTNLIEKLFLSKEEARVEKNVNINMNIALAKVESFKDPDIENYVNALREKVKLLQETVKIYKEKSERLERTLNAVKQALSYGDVNTAKKVLGLR